MVRCGTGVVNAPDATGVALFAGGAAVGADR